MNTSSPPNRKHYYAIDTLRGIAATAVCIFHFTNGNPALLPDGSWLKEMGSYGFLGVEIFFVISGMVIANTMARNDYRISEIGNFLMRRLVRLEPPYLLSIALVLALNFLSSLAPGYSGESFSFNAAQLALHLGYLVPFWGAEWLSPVYWSLGIELQFYLVMALIFPFLFSRRKWPFPLALLLSVILFVFVSLEHIFFNYVLYFFIGFLLFMREEKRLDPRLIIGMIALCVAFISWKDGWMNAAAGLFPALFVIYLGHRRFGAAEFLGKISYSLYLIHVPIGGRVINLAVRVSDHPAFTFLAVLLALSVSIASAYLFYRLIEEPSIRWAKNVSYRMKKEPVRILY